MVKLKIEKEKSLVRERERQEEDSHLKLLADGFNVLRDSNCAPAKVSPSVLIIPHLVFLSTYKYISTHTEIFIAPMCVFLINPGASCC